MLNRKIAANLYLDLLVSWETEIKLLVEKGNFDLRSKPFTEFKRTNELVIKIEKTRDDSDILIFEYLSEDLKPEQIVIIAKGDDSGARSLLRHSRNSIAHANVSIDKIRNKNFVIFRAMHQGKQVFYAQILQGGLNQYIAAIKSTVKNNG